MKQRFFLFTFFIFFAASAKEEDSINIFSNRHVKLQKEVCIKRSYCDMYRSYFNPLEADKGLIFFEGSYLYWKPSAKIPYAYTMGTATFSNPDLSRNFRTNKKIHRVGLKMKSGFQVLAGAYLPRNGWTTSLSYQYLKKRENDNAQGAGRTTVASGDDTEALAAIWLTTYLANTDAKLTSSSAFQTLSYKIFDWTFRKSIFWESKFGLSPYFGLKGAWIKNDLDVTYLGVAISGSTLTNISTNADVSTQFRGWGLRAGFNASWLLGCGFEAFSNNSYGLLWGKHDFIHKERSIVSIDQTPADSDITSHIAFRDLRSCLQNTLGLFWGTHFWQDSAYFGVKIAYETTLWPNLLQLRRIYRAPELTNSRPSEYLSLNSLNRSLSFNGLTLSAKLDF